MTQQNNEFEKWYKEKHFGCDFYPKYYQFRKEVKEAFEAGWQAAKADSAELHATAQEYATQNAILMAKNENLEREIVKLKDEINDLNKEQTLLNKWLDSNRVWFENSNKEIAELKDENEQLTMAQLKTIQLIKQEQAHINVLREALERSSKSLEAIDFDWECEHGFHQDKCPNPVCEVKAYWDAIAISKKALTSTPAQSLQAHDNEAIERCAKVADNALWAGKVAGDKIRALKGQP